MNYGAKKIKVVVGVNDFLVGGIQRQFIEQLRFFDPDRFDITLITLFEFPNQANLYHDLPADLAPHRLNFKSIRDVASWKALYLLLKKLEPDIVVSNLFFANTVFRLLKPLVGYRVIACEHNTYTDKTFFQKFTDHVLSTLSYKIVAVSETVASFTAKQEMIPRDKFTVISNGIDVPVWQQRFRELPSKEILRKELGVSLESTLILSVARLMPQKNHKLLLEGFALFHKEFPQSVLAIVGGGPLLETLKALAANLKISDATLFFGVRSDVERFYKASDVFVLTSDIEGFGLVCIEAMSAGLPVVSTATAGPDEYIKDGVNGLLIRTRTAPAVAEGLKRIVAGDIDHLRTGALETAGRYTTAVSVKQYEKLFEEAVLY